MEQLLILEKAVNIYLKNYLLKMVGFKTLQIHHDLAYLIEDQWDFIKPRIKRRNPASLEELKKFLIEEWNSIPLNLVQNLCVNYLKRIKKVFDLNGERLEPEVLRKYKKNREEYFWETPN